MKAWLTDNLALKVIALLLALVLHLFLRGDREEVQAIWVPVKATIAPNRVLLSDVIGKIKVTVRGKRSALNHLEEEGIPPLNLDLSSIDNGTFEFTPDLFRVTPGVTITAVKPPSMRVDTDVREKKQVQVLTRPQGSVAAGFRVTGRRVDPAEVTVSGPQRNLRELSAVVTDPVDISGRTLTFTTTVPIRDMASSNVTFSPALVAVTFEIEPIVGQRTFEDVPVAARTDGDELVEVTPEVVSITVRGPEVLLNEMRMTDIVAQVETPTLGERDSAQFTRPVLVEGLPRDITLVKVAPESVRVVVRRAAPPAPE